jgi:2-amino-4-hydroxy-6-hydroxymethyldihydropteridine diphosphokinase
MSSTYVVGLGGNLGSRAATFQAAIALLGARPGIRIERCSPIYESEPLGPPQPSYLNAAVRLESELGPLALLEQTLAVERELGRDRTTRWAARSLDLDLLWSSSAHQSATLTVPHRELDKRWFALQPLLDVAPELEPAYRERLATLGERREPLGMLEALVCAEVTREPNGFHIVASGAPDDALAALLSALGRTVHPESTCQALRTIAIPMQEHAGMRDPVAGVCALLEQGFVLVAASAAPSIWGEPSSVRIVGCSVTPYVALRAHDVRRVGSTLYARFEARST